MGGGGRRDLDETMSAGRMGRWRQLLRLGGGQQQQL